MASKPESGFGTSVANRRWIGVGKDVGGVLTAADALKAAGLDWTVSLKDLYARVDSGVVKIEDKRAMVRDADDTVLGVVGTRYNPYQNHQAFTFMDNIVDSGEAKYTSAGSLDGGRRVWIQALFPDHGIKIAGMDPIDLYLLVTTTHNGTGSFTASVVPNRLQCQNALNFTLKGAQQQIKLRHTKTLEGRVEEARKALSLTFEYGEVFEREMNKLAEEDFGKDDFVRLIKSVFPANENKDGQGSLSSEQEAMIKNLLISPTIQDELRFTKWGALNAVSEYVDWLRPRRHTKGKSLEESRLTAAWFGTNVTDREQVVNYLLTV